MKRHIRLLSGILLILSFLALLPVPAVAAPLLTQIGGDSVNVAAGESVESVMAIGTDTHIAGTVTDIVLVINGNVYLEPTAKVDLVINLGGQVSNHSTNEMKDGIFELNFTQQFLNNLFLGGVLLFGFWFMRLVLSLAGVVLLTGLGYLSKNSSHRSERLISSTSVVRLFGIGVACLLVIIALVVLLSLSIVGIPLAGILVIVALIAAFLGTLPIIKFLGEKILSPKLLDYPQLTRLLIQSVIFVSLANIPLLGFVFLLVVGIIGLGVTLSLSWIYLKQRKRSAT